MSGPARIHCVAALRLLNTRLILLPAPASRRVGRCLAARGDRLATDRVPRGCLPVRAAAVVVGPSTSRRSCAAAFDDGPAVQTQRWHRLPHVCPQYLPNTIMIMRSSAALCVSCAQHLRALAPAPSLSRLSPGLLRWAQLALLCPRRRVLEMQLPEALRAGVRVQLRRPVGPLLEHPRPVGCQPLATHWTCPASMAWGARDKTRERERSKLASHSEAHLLARATHYTWKHSPIPGQASNDKTNSAHRR
jgi:hypothetical protein